MATRVGSVTPQFFADVTLDPSSVPAYTIQTETLTVTGLSTDWVVSVNVPNLEVGLFLIDSMISAANTLKLVFHNPTSAAINAASQSVKVVAH